MTELSITTSWIPTRPIILKNRVPSLSKPPSERGQEIYWECPLHTILYPLPAHRFDKPGTYEESDVHCLDRRGLLMGRFIDQSSGLYKIVRSL